MVIVTEKQNCLEKSQIDIKNGIQLLDSLLHCFNWLFLLDFKGD